MLANSCYFSGKLVPKSDYYHLEVAPNKYAARLILPLKLSPHDAETADELFHVSYNADVSGYLQHNEEGGIYLEVTYLELHGFGTDIAAAVREQLDG